MAPMRLQGLNSRLDDEGAGISPSSAPSLSSFFSWIVAPNRGLGAAVCPPKVCDGGGEANALNMVNFGVLTPPGVGRVIEEPEVPNEN